MGKEKAGFMTPKAIGNRIKAKGLQKLRWYCQMCQKQCRDENGFKCHCMSESHQRQLLLFADNADEYLDSFSKEFMETFLDMLKRRYGTRRIHCNIVYNEFIADREHTHMNSTKWQTLTDFIMYLGKEGAVAVDPTEKGIFITYIDRDPETLRRQEILLKREKFEALEAEKAERQLEEQVLRGQEHSKPIAESVYTELKRGEASEEKIAFSLSASSAAAATATVGASSVSTAPPDDTAQRALEEAPAASKSVSLAARPLAAAKLNPLEEAAKKAGFAKQQSRMESSGGLKRKSALDEIMEEEEKRKKRRMISTTPSSSATAAATSASSSAAAQDDRLPGSWLARGIVVKVVNKQSSLYKMKCSVEEVRDRGKTAMVRSPEGGPRYPTPDSDLETVIPAIGGSVVILRGEHRGREAVLEKINVDSFSVNVTVVKNMKTINRVPYEDVSKMASKH